MFDDVMLANYDILVILQSIYNRSQFSGCMVRIP